MLYRLSRCCAASRRRVHLEGAFACSSFKQHEKVILKGALLLLLAVAVACH